MPTETFFKLPNEKKSKILQAAKKEIATAKIEEISIKNIVEEAEIARGSFYQYFTSKEDMLAYLIERQMEELKQKMEKELQKCNGEITEVFLTIYDCIIHQMVKNKDRKVYAKIFANIKAGEENYFLKPPKEENNHFYEKYIHKENLKISSEEDFRIIISIFHAITSYSVGHTIKTKEFEKERQDLIKRLAYIKTGIEKERGGLNAC